MYGIFEHIQDCQKLASRALYFISVDRIDDLETVIRSDERKIRVYGGGGGVKNNGVENVVVWRSTAAHLCVVLRLKCKQKLGPVINMYRNPFEFWIM